MIIFPLILTLLNRRTALKSEARSRAAIAELLSSISPERAPQTRSRTFTMAMVEISPQPQRELPSFKETPLTELYVEGMNDDQVWEQLELRAKNLCELIDFSTETSLEGPGNDKNNMEELRNMMRMNGLDEDGMDEDADEVDPEYGESDDDDEDEVSHEDEDDEDDGDEVLGEHVAELKDPSDSEDEDEHIDLDKPSLLSRMKSSSKRKSKARARGHPELDDGFFDLAVFNAETEAAEANTVSKGRLSGEDDDEEEDLQEDGLVDYLAPVDDGADADQAGTHCMFDSHGPWSTLTFLSTTITGLFYTDFFDPPPRDSGSKLKQPQAQAPKSGRVRFHEEVRVKQIKAKGKNLPLSMLYGDDDDDDEDEDDEDEEEDEESEDDGEEVEKNAHSDEDLALDEDEDDFGAMDNEMDGPNEELDGSLDEDDFTMEAAEHLKDDLFAEDENIDTGECSIPRTLRSSLLNYHLFFVEMTTHQKRMAKLQEEIAALEAENVGKKNWTLMGEASSRTRPQNSLLEEDLEFEHIMKSVPVVTEETVQGLEERITSRILESQFDDVVRKRPVDDKPFLPSRVLELQDTKSKQSLAEIYEDEYTAAQAGTLPGEDRDGKLKKEHDEITKIWESISSKLDALSNAHFTPKAVSFMCLI